MACTSIAACFLGEHDETLKNSRKQYMGFILDVRPLGNVISRLYSCKPQEKHAVDVVW
jgi:hypothetical protein